MPRGKAVPIDKRFPDPVKFSAVIDKSTKTSIDLITGKLIATFGFIPTQGQVIDYLVKFYENQEND